MSAATALLADLRARGVELAAAGDRIRFRPADAVPQEARDLLRAHRAEVLEILTRDRLTRDRERALAMPLDVYRRQGQPIEIRVPWWGETLFFVPDARHKAALVGEAIAPHRVWTATELLDVVPAAPDATALVSLMHARKVFNGEVIE